MSSGFSSSITENSHIKLYIDCFQGNIMSVLMSVAHTVKDIKMRISQDKCISIDQQQLVFNDEILENEFTLYDYGFNDEARLQLVICGKNPTNHCWGCGNSHSHLETHFCDRCRSQQFREFGLIERGSAGHQDDSEKP